MGLLKQAIFIGDTMSEIDVLDAHAQFSKMCDEWMSQEQLLRLVELTASYCHGSAEYWNYKDANVLIEMARRMALCTESAGANLYKLRKLLDAEKENKMGVDT